MVLIYISRKISIEHPSVGLASLAQQGSFLEHIHTKKRLKAQIKKKQYVGFYFKAQTKKKQCVGFYFLLIMEFSDHLLFPYFFNLQ